MRRRNCYSINVFHCTQRRYDDATETDISSLIFRMELQTVGKNEFLKLNRIDRRVRVGILETILYKSKEKVGILSLK